MATLTANRGLITLASELVRPDGALSVADNVNIDADNVVEPRRGFSEFGSTNPGSSYSKQLMVYKGRIIKHYQSKLAFDSTGSGNFQEFSGLFNEVIDKLRIKFIESNSNLYFTSSEGIKKISATSASEFTSNAGYITNAGGVKAVGFSAKVKLIESGWLPAQSKVSYSIVWATKDVNGNVIRGVPSPSVTITNVTKDIDKGEQFTIEIKAHGSIAEGQFFTFDTPENKYGVWFDKTGSAESPVNSLLVGRQLIKISIKGIGTDELTAAAVASSLSALSDIEVTISGKIVTVKNISPGDVFDAAQGTLSDTHVDISKIIDGSITKGSPANVDIISIIPTQITNTSYFYELYRTSVVTVSPGVTLADLTPSPEFQKVYEAPVTDTDLLNGEIVIEDIAPESFQQGGAFLYTNPISGEGVVQANEAPPVATDIALFKGSAFYANTKERHRLLLTLLSVSDFVSGNAKLHIGNSTSSSTYTFVGAAELVNFFAIPKSLTVGNSYFLINSARDQITYKVWFDKGELKPSSNEGTSPNISFASNHGLAVNDKVVISGTTPPSPFISGNTYYVVERNNTTIQLSSTVGGSPITFTGTFPTGVVFTHTPLEPVIANTSEVRIALQTYEDSIPGSVEAFREAFFDILDFEAKALAYNFDSTANISVPDKVIVIANHGFSNNDEVYFSGTVPTGITAGTAYYVVNSGQNAFQVAASIGGPAITLAAAVGTAKVARKKIPLQWTDNGAVTDTVASSPSPGWTFTPVNQGIGENASNRDVLLSGLQSEGLSVEDTARSLERVINSDANCPVSAYYISGEETLPGSFLLESKNLIDDNFYVSCSPSSLSKKWNPELSGASTVTSIIVAGNLFTTSFAHGFSPGQEIYVHDNTNGPKTAFSGKYTVHTTPSPTTFTLQGVVVTSNQIGINGIAYLADVFSDNSKNQNRIYFSKAYQPEAVPLVNYIDIGPKDKAIQRILALRDSLIILKEDGVYVLTGSIAPNFSVRLVDSSALTFAPDTAINLNNLIYVLTTQGVATVSETGVGIISRNIEDKVLEVSSAKFDYKLTSWGLSSESDRCYLLFLPTRTSDLVATQAFRYNTFTRAWTRWTIPATCGLVNPNDDKFYLGDGSGRGFVLQERKNFERQDYSDRNFTRTIASGALSGNDMVLSSAEGVEAGDVVLQYQYVDINKFNRLLKKLDLDQLASSNYYSTLKLSAGGSMGTALDQLSAKLNADGVLVPPTSLSEDYITIRNEFNAIIQYLNTLNSGTSFKDYKQATDLLTYEVAIAAVKLSTNTATLLYSQKFLQGTVHIFKGIRSVVQYAPQHFGKPESIKQVAEGTLIFDQNNFWGGSIAYASDRSYDFSSIDFKFRGPGFWDGYMWAEVTFGGEGNEVPMRTLIPREKARCRYLHVQFTHVFARESFKLLGISLQPRDVSPRGYR